MQLRKIVLHLLIKKKIAMNDVTFAILEDLEKEVADIKSKQSNIEVVWELQELKKSY